MSRWETRASTLLSFVRLDSIKNKIVVLAVAATLIPTVSTAGVSYVQNRRSLTEKLDEELQSAGTLTAREVDLWMRQRFYDVAVFASSFEVSENLAWITVSSERTSEESLGRLRDYVTAVESRFPDYVELLVLDRSANIVASSAETTTYRPGAASPANLGVAHLGTPVWDDDRKTMLASLSQPIRSTDGLIHGLLVAQLDLRAVGHRLSEYAAGEHGRSFLVAEDGAVLTASAGSPTLDRIEPVTHAQLLSSSTDITTYTASDGVTVLGTLEPVPGLDWAVVAEVDRDGAYAPVRRLRNVTLLIVTTVMLVMGGLAYLLGQIVVRPLARLTKGAEKVAGGDLTIDVPVTGGGEVGYLTEVFNDMVRRLRQGREALDAVNVELRESNAELERLSVTDELTQLVNRRRSMEVLAEEMERAQRFDRPMSLLMLDVDHFKAFNDSYGHPEGDVVLRAVATAIRQGTRGIDTTSRYGGEEFMVILPECGPEGAIEAATRILSRLAGETYHGETVTMSVGVAVYPEHARESDDLIKIADAALYDAKHRGRNRIVLAPGLELPPESKYAAETVPEGAPEQRSSKRRRSKAKA